MKDIEIQNNINKNNQRFQQLQQKKGCTCSLNGCAWIILFSILMGICINECESSKLRLEKEKKALEILEQAKHQIQRDTLNLQR